MKLTHSDLLDLGKLLGYPLSKDGLCAGFSGMWMQAVLFEDEESFYKRLDFIADYQDDFNRLKKEIEETQEKVRQKRPRDDKDEALLDVLSFFEGIELYLNSNKYADLFNQIVEQNEMATIHALAKPILEEQECSILFDKGLAFDKTKLTNYLTDLAKLIEQSGSPLPIVLETDAHSVCLKYDSSEGCWHYVDTNDFYRFPDEPSYYRKLDTANLAESLFNSFNKTDHPYTVFNTRILAKNPAPELKTLVEGFDATYTIEEMDVKLLDARGLGLLSLACSMGDLKSVGELLKFNVDVNQATTDDGSAALHFACQDNNFKMVHELLEHQANANQTKKKGAAPLHMACIFADEKIVQDLLAHNADINQIRASDGATPLHLACMLNRVEIVREFLKHKEAIDPNKEANDGTTPLYQACHFGDREIVHELLNHPTIDVNKESEEGMTPLFIATLNGRLEIVRELLKNSLIDVNKAEANTGKTPLYSACVDGNIEIVRELLKQPAKHPPIDVNKEANDGTTPLGAVCLSNNPGIVRELLKQSTIDVNKIANNLGHTALAIANVMGNKEIFRELLKHPSIDFNKSSIDGNEQFYRACETGDLELVKALANHSQIDINKESADGKTPLYIASEMGHVDIVSELLKHQADANQQCTSNKITPFQLACRTGNLNVVIELLTSNQIQNIDDIALNNYTALTIACFAPKNEKKATLLTVLLQFGANLAHKNGEGNSPIDILWSRKDYDSLHTVLSFAKDNNLNPQQLMKTESRNKIADWAKTEAPELFDYLEVKQAPKVQPSKPGFFSRFSFKKNKSEQASETKKLIH